MPSQQPTALMPTPTMQPQMTTPTMGGAQNQYAPPTMAGVGGFPQQQQPPPPQGVPMSAPPSSVMSAPATSIPAPSTSIYGGGPPQQLLQQPTNTTPLIAHGAGISGIPMAMTSGVATAGGMVAPQVSMPSTPAVAMATASGGIGMPPASVNTSIGGTVSGVGGSAPVTSNGTEKKKKKKKVHAVRDLYNVRVGNQRVLKDRYLTFCTIKCEPKFSFSYIKFWTSQILKLCS